MKKIMMVLVLMGLAQAPAHADSELSTKQKKLIVNLIDSLCGDTWCEGDWGYSFDRLTKSRDGEGYNLYFRIIYAEDHTYNAKCEFSAYKEFTDFVSITKSRNGKKIMNLDESFMEDLDSCIEEQSNKGAE